MLPPKQDIKELFSVETDQPMAKYLSETDFWSSPDETAASPSDQPERRKAAGQETLFMHETCSQH